MRRIGTVFRFLMPGFPKILILYFIYLLRSVRKFRLSKFFYFTNIILTIIYTCVTKENRLISVAKLNYNLILIGTTLMFTLYVILTYTFISLGAM